MNVRNWESFSCWKKIYTEKGMGIESPFHDEPLTEDSIYFWNQMSVPLPSGSTHGEWGCFPEAKALTGFIRYIVFPAFFGIWLVREEWDKDPDRFVNSDELLTMAEKSGKCRYAEDIPLMKTLISELDAIIDKPNEQINSELKKVAKKFNNRWSDTPTWCFEINIFDTPEEVGIEIMDRLSEDVQDEDIEDELGISKNDWIKICGNAISDPEAKVRFIEVLEENAWY